MGDADIKLDWFKLYSRGSHGIPAACVSLDGADGFVSVKGFKPFVKARTGRWRQAATGRDDSFTLRAAGRRDKCDGRKKLNSTQ